MEATGGEARAEQFTDGYPCHAIIILYTCTSLFLKALYIIMGQSYLFMQVNHVTPADVIHDNCIIIVYSLDISDIYIVMLCQMVFFHKTKMRT